MGSGQRLAERSYPVLERGRQYFAVQPTLALCQRAHAGPAGAAARLDKARVLFTRLAGLRNDVGWLAEEYDHGRKRQVGNFPQVFSHPALIGTAHSLLDASGPVHQRSANMSATA